MNIQTEEQRLTALSALKKLTQSKGWKILIDYLDEKIQNLENQIFEVNPQNNEIKFTGHDLHRFERSNLIGLKDLPINLIKNIDGFVFQRDFDEEE